MNLKNPKLWGAIVAVVLAVVGAAVGMDIKGAVCSQESVVSQ